MPTKPKPFKRPSVDLGKVPKSWKDLPLRYVRVGDIVLDKGAVAAISHFDRPELGLIQIVLRFKSDEVHSGSSEEVLRVFSED